MVHGEVAEQVRAGQVIEHQGQSLRVRLVAQQDAVQVPDPSGLTQLVALPAGEHEEEDEDRRSMNITIKGNNQSILFFFFITLNVIKEIFECINKDIYLLITCLCKKSVSPKGQTRKI